MIGQTSSTHIPRRIRACGETSSLGANEHQRNPPDPPHSRFRNLLPRIPTRELDATAMQRCTDIIVADAASSIAVSPARLLPPTTTPPPLTRQQQRRHPPYEHAPLSSPTSIRLLTLHPATPTAPGIHCTLHEADLASPPAFEALSYTWALDRTPRTGRTRTIVCNGRALAAQRCSSCAGAAAACRCGSTRCASTRAATARRSAVSESIRRVPRRPQTIRGGRNVSWACSLDGSKGRCRYGRRGSVCAICISAV